MYANVPSKIILHGGTHNLQAPPFDFIQQCYLPILKKMGVQCEANLEIVGFYPAGGGKVVFHIEPIKELVPLSLTLRGKHKRSYAEAWFAHMPVNIAKRELTVMSQELALNEDNLFLREITKAACAGNALTFTMQHGELIEIITSICIRGMAAEKVATEACLEAKRYLKSKAVVGAHLADQILIPMALSGKGKFTTLNPSQHTLTNIEVIKQFLNTEIVCHELEDDLWQLEIINNN